LKSVKKAVEAADLGSGPNVEESLKVLAATLKTLGQPGLSAAEIRRCGAVIRASRAYQKLFAEYVQYCRLVRKDPRAALSDECVKAGGTVLRS